jgi:ADP-L-glycero-D-manno-heptose 6-epimerase
MSIEKKIRFLYASSAATYGAGERGYSDDEAIIPFLKPLNPYGWSKHIFDKWVLKQEKTPPSWIGLKFFNVYGPNEYHKGQMSSVIFHAFKQVKKNGTIRLFKSHRKEFSDGEQKRDFIYIKDVVDIINFLLKKNVASGIYNIGTGKAQSFNSLAQAVFHSMSKNAHIQYFDMPKYIKNQYQYFTEARIDKIKNVGYNKKFNDLKAGIRDYIQSYLNTDEPYL